MDPGDNQPGRQQLRPSAALTWPGTVSSTAPMSGVANSIRVCAARLGRCGTSRICFRLIDTAINSKPTRAAAAVATDAPKPVHALAAYAVPTVLMFLTIDEAAHDPEELGILLGIGEVACALDDRELRAWHRAGYLLRERQWHAEVMVVAEEQRGFLISPSCGSVSCAATLVFSRPP